MSSAFLNEDGTNNSQASHARLSPRRGATAADQRLIFQKNTELPRRAVPRP